MNSRPPRTVRREGAARVQRWGCQGLEFYGRAVDKSAHNTDMPAPFNPPATPSPGAAPTPSGLACRPGCGACCIAPSISSPIPGMPNGKPAGVRCIQLMDDQRCAIFGHPERPEVCASLMPSADMCGDSRTQALAWLGVLEDDTAPPSSP
jgi:hypothetical protein